ncbi:accessory factor UbiK family protein [Ferrimonas gelatinilytica]|uniref:Ubiquinone biosynthesis accessory factor UbiK n=1 Tax=Ferrimonas gelatinilytica TaxID=1255257 RepID=A0ABP9RTT9_9GAMM
MLTPQKLEELAKQLSDTLPPGLKTAADEFELKAKALMQAQLTKLDFVPREEFDRQAAVLAKTRMMVEKLEQRVSALEAQHTQDAE